MITSVSGVSLEYNTNFMICRRTTSVEMALHQQQPSLNPVVPYKSFIRGGLKPGKVIIVQGIINTQAHRFELNLHHKLGIAFHYKICFDQNEVVRNTFENGKWGMEEKSAPMPFRRGEQTLVTIFCHHDQYKVFVNGKETHTYKHRFIKLEEIDVLGVNGDIQLDFVQP